MYSQIVHHKLLYRLLATILVIVSTLSGKAQYSISSGGRIDGNQLHYQISPKSSPFSKIISSKNFKKGTENVLNLGMSDQSAWVKIHLINNWKDNPFLVINNSMLDRIIVYQPQANQIDTLIQNTNPFKVLKSGLRHEVKLLLKVGESSVVYLKIDALEQLMIPLTIEDNSRNSISGRIDIFILGTYLGIVLIMALYNLFLFFSTKDRSYLYYVIYVFFVGLTQLGIKGINMFAFISETVYFQNSTLIIYSSIAAFFGIIFTRDFLHVKDYSPRLDKVLVGLCGLFILAVLFLFVSLPAWAFITMQISTVVSAVLIFIVSVIALKKRLKSAKFFFLAWTILLAGAILFTLKDFGILPYNTFTSYLLILASSLEMALLSFALADKINILRIEKDEARIREVKALKSNEKLIKEQNVILETKVTERTKELSDANEELEQVLSDLKQAQAQLVNQEKMASLGQLTAGIAHEINNPINFVASNLEPLKLDIEDLKELLKKYQNISSSQEFENEIDSIKTFTSEIDLEYELKEIDELLDGIKVGAQRTAEIVEGLKSFSRLDEGDHKISNVHAGIDSTLLILKSANKAGAEIEKQYDNTISEIECYPGKLNQVFANLISNAFQAMENNPEGTPPKLVISTKDLQEHIQVSIKDNGSGIPKKDLDKIFEPFFTTKDVGQGTGLGLSIVFSIIKQHQGKITVNSDSNSGTEFKITLPKKLSRVG